MSVPGFFPIGSLQSMYHAHSWIFFPDLRRFLSRSQVCVKVGMCGAALPSLSPAFLVSNLVPGADRSSLSHPGAGASVELPIVRSTKVSSCPFGGRGGAHRAAAGSRFPTRFTR